MLEADPSAHNGPPPLRAQSRPECASELFRRQRLLQTLNESRFDSMQRLVAFFVLFHAMGKAVADWWPAVSLGFLGYDMSRSQSIMRVATTASPVPAMDVRERILQIREQLAHERAARSLQRAWRAGRLVGLVRSIWLRRRTAAGPPPERCGGAPLPQVEEL